LTKSKTESWEQGTGALASTSFIFSFGSIYVLLEGASGLIESLIIAMPVLFYVLAILAGFVAHNLRWGLASTSLVYCAWGCSMGLIGLPIILLYKLGTDGFELILYSIGLGLLFLLMTKLLKKSLLNQKM